MTHQFNHPQQFPMLSKTHKYVLTGEKALLWKRWSSTEELYYHIFIYHHAQKFGDRKKPHNIFKLMSQFISTKNKSQCKNHHHKIYGGQIEKRLEIYQANCPNFLDEYELLKHRLISQEQELLYENLISKQTKESDEHCQENRSKESYEQVNQESNTFESGESRLKGSKTPMTKLQYLSKLNSLLYYYRKWEEVSGELLSLESKEEK